MNLEIRININLEIKINKNLDKIIFNLKRGRNKKRVWVFDVIDNYNPYR